MATKKAGSTAKKKTTSQVKSTPAAKPQTTTKVTTVKAASAETTTVSKARFGNRTFIASALIGEFIGTFLLTVVFMGTKGDPLYLGLALTGIVLMVGTLSGAHLNPAVTVGAWVTRKITTLRGLGYLVAQVLGGTLAFAALSVFINTTPKVDPQQAAMMGQSVPQLFKVATLTDKNQWFVFFIELVAAAIFTFAVASARRETTDRAAKAFAIGLGLLVAGVFGTIAAGYVSANTVFNPAIALAVQAVDWTKLNWVALAAYLIAPLLGGVLGFALRDLLASSESRKA